MSQIESHHLTASDVGGGGFLDWLKETTTGASEIAQTIWQTINTIENKPADNVTPGPKPNQSGTQQPIMSADMKKLIIGATVSAVVGTFVVYLIKKK